MRERSVLITTRATIQDEVRACALPAAAAAANVSTATAAATAELEPAAAAALFYRCGHDGAKYEYDAARPKQAFFFADAEDFTVVVGHAVRAERYGFPAKSSRHLAGRLKIEVRATRVAPHPSSSCRRRALRVT